MEEGRGGDVRQSLLGGKLALSLHERDPKNIDLIEVYREIAKAYLPVKLPDEKFFPQGVGFLGRDFNNVSHYNYAWSEVSRRTCSASSIARTCWIRRLRNATSEPCSLRGRRGRRRN